MAHVDPADPRLAELLTDEQRAALRQRRPRTADDHEERGGDRRLADRRGLGFTARRHDEADLNLQRRAFLSTFICDLPRATLRLWIDGLWLGIATEAQLAMLVDAAQQQRATDTTAKTTKNKVGRPAGSPLDDDELRAAWNSLTQEFKPFSRDRKHHFHPPKLIRPTDFRRKCRGSSIGQRVDRSGLFDALFDDQTLGPGPMAARLMHQERTQQLTALEQAARTQATTAASVVSRDMSLLRADQAADLLKQFPAWRTLYDWLRKTP